MTTKQLELFPFVCPFCNNTRYEWVSHPMPNIYSFERPSLQMIDVGSRGEYWDGSPYMDCCIELHNAMTQEDK